MNAPKIRHRIDGTLLVVEGHGVIRIRDVIATWDAIQESPGYHVDIVCLADMSGATLQFRYRDALKLARYLGRSQILGQMAVVTPSNVDYSVARMIVGVVGKAGVFGVARVFRNRDAALRWLETPFGELEE